MLNLRNARGIKNILKKDGIWSGFPLIDINLLEEEDVLCGSNGSLDFQRWKDFSCLQL